MREREMQKKTGEVKSELRTNSRRRRRLDCCSKTVLWFGATTLLLPQIWSKQQHHHRWSSTFRPTTRRSQMMMMMKGNNISLVAERGAKPRSHDEPTARAAWEGQLYVPEGNSCVRLIEALDSPDRLHLLRIRATSDTYASLLQECSNRKALVEGRLLHAHIVKSGLMGDLFIANHLIVMYNNCRSVLDAREVFDTMPLRNLVTWNAMIGGYGKCGYGKEALALYQQMHWENVKPNSITFLTILNVCAYGEMITVGKLIHGHIVDTGVESDPIIGNALINMYEKCGSIENAHRVFHKMPVRNVVSWTALITACSRHGHREHAFIVFQQMQKQGVKPNAITFASILGACANPDALALGKLVHAHIVDVGVELDVVVRNTLVNMYGRCGSVDDARRTFDTMHLRNVVSWTAMIAAYSRYGHAGDAFKLFHQMLQEGMVPNKVTLISTLDACASSEALALGKLAHAFLFVVGLESDVVVGTSIVHMYEKCGSTSDAYRMFNEMPTRNIVTWNVMIKAYAQHDHLEEAFKLLHQMQHTGLKPDRITFIIILNACNNPERLALGKLVHAHSVDEGAEQNVVVGNALVNMYGKCRSIKAARKIFDNMLERDIISYNSMIAAYAKDGFFDEAFHIFQLLQQQGLKPNQITVINILNACINSEALSVGRQLHAFILDEGFELHITVGNSLLNMYGNCGSIQEVRMMFDKMTERDAFSWSAMIKSYARHGHGKEAIQIFQQMQKESVKPDKITFINVLDACSHAGLIDEGLYCFNCMSQDHGIAPAMEHYNCMIDLFGRAGQLDEAENLIKRMPLQPSAVLWMTLLCSYRIHGCINGGKRVAEHALQLNSE